MTQPPANSVVAGMAPLSMSGARCVGRPANFRHARPSRSKFWCGATALLLLLASCQVTQSSRESVQPIRVLWSAEPSTATFRATQGLGHYELVEFTGKADVSVVGAERYKVKSPARPESSRAVGHALLGDTAVLRRDASGVLLELGTGASKVVLELQIVTGTWEGFAAGGDLVLQLGDRAWEHWNRATQDAFRQLIETFRARVEPRLRRRQRVTEAEVDRFAYEEKPLVRANRSQLLVFFEGLELEGGFAVATRRGGFAVRVHPGLGRALADIAAVTAYVALEVGVAALRCTCRR